MRRATAADLPLLVELAARHHEATGETDPFCGRSAHDFALAIMSSPVGSVWVCGAGSLGAVLVPQLYNRECLIATEVWFNAFDGGGRALLDAFTAWGRESGAKRALMTTIARHRPDVMERLMGRYGWKPETVIYGKEIG